MAEAIRKNILKRPGIQKILFASWDLVTVFTKTSTREAWRTPGAARDLAGAARFDGDPENAGAALEDAHQVARGVVAEPRHDPEAVTQRGGEQTRPGRGPGQREAWRRVSLPAAS